MPEPLPTLLIPALFATPRLYAEQLPALWRIGRVMVADHRRHADMPALAAQALAKAPPRFRLLGLSMGGYVAFEILRQAPQRARRRSPARRLRGCPPWPRRCTLGWSIPRAGLTRP